MKANELRTLIANLLQNYNSYYGDNTGSFDEFDYKINYQIDNAVLLENQRTYIVDFDIWCKDTSKIDNYTDIIENLLNYTTYETATFYLDNRYHADEKEVYRRTLTYEVRTF